MKAEDKTTITISKELLKKIKLAAIRHDMMTYEYVEYMYTKIKEAEARSENGAA
jgi:hypothetical protein